MPMPARVVKLADTPDLGSGALGVRVQVPSLAILLILHFIRTNSIRQML